ncbi:transglutaminase-like domain-containing protein [Aestuariibaculum lutulentum]|uniref:Transglutaminase-like domain-containing protein n=1 Tax=Aestuariibaculum lutulentum TaxID=2920935 RepID=A0ABS9RI68_9FLAO|nr:transglutaminase-like domain-containing protein [Aestuariibaculum lutulentum]MCH4552206.1 transglutaminase-like domain-containing protein [Aestuariibaculum lutulentum]
MRFTTLFILTIMLNSCSGCSNSGRAKIVAKARSEAAKQESTPTPQTIIKDVEPEIVEIIDIVTPKEKEEIDKNLIKEKIPKAKGKLIQVEGLVLKEVAELTIKLNTSSSPIEQILALKNHIQSNWHYIFDPDTGSDTWRSAEATISLKYNGQYSGDCDDFAILMASIARQIGLSSRMVGGFDGTSGHAFAEFLIPYEELTNPLIKTIDLRKDYRGFWGSLDWFSGYEHNRYTEDIRLFDDI